MTYLRERKRNELCFNITSKTPERKCNLESVNVMDYKISEIDTDFLDVPDEEYSEPEVIESNEMERCFREYYQIFRNVVNEERENLNAPNKPTTPPRMESEHNKYVQTDLIVPDNIEGWLISVRDRAEALCQEMNNFINFTYHSPTKSRDALDQPSTGTADFSAKLSLEIIPKGSGCDGSCYEAIKTRVVSLLQSAELLKKSLSSIQSEKIVEMGNSVTQLVDKETQTEESKKIKGILKRKKRVVGTPIKRNSNAGTSRTRKRVQFKSVETDNQQPNLRYNRMPKRKSSVKRHRRSLSNIPDYDRPGSTHHAKERFRRIATCLIHRYDACSTWTKGNRIVYSKSKRYRQRLSNWISSTGARPMSSDKANVPNGNGNSQNQGCQSFSIIRSTDDKENKEVVNLDDNLKDQVPTPDAPSSQSELPSIRTEAGNSEDIRTNTAEDTNRSSDRAIESFRRRREDSDRHLGSSRHKRTKRKMFKELRF
ncbi:hypothetical protein CEXT_743861 [Caerostris extrusa]|uniref:Uncharacterized protein n=1 Tax=Caerostris extrusa TaxID=172846 RepID=A0AAV4VIZ7_CAEEX|nr:hypothetical protein CEXT_743861 [Caerostris extrusa]